MLAFASACCLHGLRADLGALRERVDALTLAALVATGAAGAFAVAHAVHGGAPVHTATAAVAVVALALVPTAFAVSAFLSGLGRIGASRASIASSLEPAVAVACGVLLLGERLVPMQFLGAGLVVGAVLAIELRQLPAPARAAVPAARPALPAPRIGKRAAQSRSMCSGWSSISAWSRRRWPVTSGCLRWAAQLGEPAFAVEGCGSYGAGLARFLVTSGCLVCECERPRRGDRRRGKNDVIDAALAARRLLSGSGLSTPRGGGQREYLRVLLVERRGATQARTAALNQLHALVVTAPDGLRERLTGLSNDATRRDSRSAAIEL